MLLTEEDSPAELYTKVLSVQILSLICGYRGWLLCPQPGAGLLLTSGVHVRDLMSVGSSVSRPFWKHNLTAVAAP
jgi:hypothetical protein